MKSNFPYLRLEKLKLIFLSAWGSFNKGHISSVAILTIFPSQTHSWKKFLKQNDFYFQSNARMDSRRMFSHSNTSHWQLFLSYLLKFMALQKIATYLTLFLKPHEQAEVCCSYSSLVVSTVLSSSPARFRYHYFQTSEHKLKEMNQ